MPAAQANLVAASNWSVRGSQTGVREAHGLECARLTDWSARGARTGVRKAHGLECVKLTDSSAIQRPYLDGPVGADGRLTAANGITVRLAKGNNFKLDLGDFTLRFNDGGNSPKIEFAIDNVSGERGVLNAGVTGQIQGFMLYAAGDVNKVVFAGAAGTETEVTAFSRPTTGSRAAHRRVTARSA